MRPTNAKRSDARKHAGKGLPMVMQIVLVCLIVGAGAGVAAAEMPGGQNHTNSLGMRFARIEPGTFKMGFEGKPLSETVAEKPWRLNGDYDEKPAHEVTITKPFYMGALEVTNAQYEQFDPDHRAFRDKLGFSKEDDEAVVFVSWQDAVRFCEWLSEKEGMPCRLPTEAEWEYACRANTSTPFNTGDEFPAEYHKHQKRSWYPDPERPSEGEVMPLTVGTTPANALGLHDMHGNVEEWCHDWYGPYAAAARTDPVGRADGDFRVTRGGSHGTETYYLRSANRSGTLPEDRNWYIGLRVVIGEVPKANPLPVLEPALWARDVQQTASKDAAPDPAEPCFEGPRQYVKIPEGAEGAMWSKHNHCPAVVACPNGDLLAIWYSCVEEPGRELCILASRLRNGQKEWDAATPFWDAPDRNDHASALWFDGDKTIYHFNGLGAAATWGNLATVMRTSTDNGATWSRARMINPEHGRRNMPIESVFRTQDGAILLPCDAVTSGEGGTAIHLSYDNGGTWTDPGGKAAGIHAGVCQLSDGRLMALGRGNNVDDRMPMSLSSDMGGTWTYQASEFPPIGSGQRLVLMRLKEGPLFLASFGRHVAFTDALGNERVGKGLFATVSHDDGKTWAPRRLVTGDGPGREVEAMDGRLFPMDGDNAEPKGYMSGCQDADGLIHLISSRQHYAFNLAWVTAAPPAR
jgi:formylglycine-generating enzyme required for sulfatase activity